MPEYSDYIEGLTSANALDGSEIVGLSQGGAARKTTTQNIANLAGVTVTSVFGRTGAITSQPGDYTVGQVTGAAPLASPAFTGTPSLPTGTTAITQTAGDNSTKLATTAYVDTAVSGAWKTSGTSVVTTPTIQGSVTFTGGTQTITSNSSTNALTINHATFTGLIKIYQSANDTSTIVGGAAGGSASITLGPTNRIFLNNETWVTGILQAATVRGGTADISSGTSLTWDSAPLAPNAATATSVSVIGDHKPQTGGTSIALSVIPEIDVVDLATAVTIIGIDYNPTIVDLQSATHYGLLIRASTLNGFGLSAPTATVHIAAGTTSKAPFKLTSGPVLSTAQTGAIEYDGTNLFFTRTGTTRESVICSNAVSSVSPTAPNRTITVVIAGTTYYIHAKTTND